MTNSGGSWTQRQGMHLRRLCARPGCGKPATATLRFQPTLRQAWLVDLDDSASRTQGDLCRRHAADLVLPRGWELHDERTTRPRLVDEPAPASSAPARRVRVRKRPADRTPAPDQLPGFAPVVVPAEPEPAAEPADDVPASEAVVEESVIEEPPVVEEPVIEEVVIEVEVEVVEVVDEIDEIDEAEDEPSSSPRPVPAQFGANDGDDPEVDEELSTILDARTPLLQRAFRNAKPEEPQD